MNILCLSILSFSFPIAAFAQTSPSFGIYLTRLSESDIQTLERKPVERKPVDLETVPLEPTPLISEKDIVEYRYPSHIIKLTPEGFKKATAIKVHDVSHGIPFVVVAGGRKIYMGMFWSSASSIPTLYPFISDLSPYFVREASGCSTCIQISPSKADGWAAKYRLDGRDAAYLTLKMLGLLKEDLNPKRPEADFPKSPVK